LIADARYNAKKMLKDRCKTARSRLLFHSRCASIGTLALLILWLSLSASLKAQERVRSAAGKYEIESFRNPEAFFRIGPFEELLIGSVGVGYTDNANLTPTQKVSDLNFTQALSLNSTWIISHFNQLQFNFGGQVIEHFYGNGRDVVNFAISPDSLIQFQFIISNYRVRLYDQIAYAQNPTTDPTATGTANLNSFTNTVGATVDADLNRAILSFLADYTYNSQSGTTVQGQTNPTTSGTRNSVRVGSSVSFYWTPILFYGLETTATRSSGSHSANINSLNVGPFIRGKLSKLTDLDLAGGASLFDTSAPISPTTYYFNAIIRHQINRNFQLILSASHDLVFTTSTDLTEETIFRAGTQLNLTRFITFATSPYVDFGNEKTGGNPGRFTLFGVEAGLVWKPHKRWTAALTYDLSRREADSAANTYIQNALAFRVNYAF
jgi:hypothetical protein